MYTLLWPTFLMIALPVWAKGDDSMRANIFLDNPILDDYGPPPATATVILYDCSSSHRPSSESVGEFQVYHNGQWWSQACPERLVWNQTLCRCEYPGGQRPAVECRDYRPAVSGQSGKYEQVVNGAWIQRDCSLTVAGLVWDQTACQCVWGPGSDRVITGQAITPCDVMLNITFDNGLQDVAKGAFIEVARGTDVPLVALSGPEGFYAPRAAYFSDAALNIWHFADNEMGSSLRVEFTFQLEQDETLRDQYQMILSNGCNVTKTGFTTPSIAIGYRPADQTYLLAFETSNARKAIVCQRQLGAYDWHTVSLIYEDGTLLLRVDGHPCIISQDFTGTIQKTPCPLMLGADPLERQSFYKGYLDNVVIARYCRRFTDKEQPDQPAPNAIPDTGLPNSNPQLDQTRGRLYGNQPYFGSLNDQKYESVQDDQHVNTAGSLDGPRVQFNDRFGIDAPPSDHEKKYFIDEMSSQRKKVKTPWYERESVFEKQESTQDKTHEIDFTNWRDVLREHKSRGINNPVPHEYENDVEITDEMEWEASEDAGPDMISDTITSNVADDRPPLSVAISQGIMMKGARRIGRRQPKWFERPMTITNSEKATESVNIDKSDIGIVGITTQSADKWTDSPDDGQVMDTFNNYESEDVMKEDIDYKVVYEAPKYEENFDEMSAVESFGIGAERSKKAETPVKTKAETPGDEWYTDDLELPEDLEELDHLSLLLKYPPYNGREFEQSELAQKGITD